LAPNIGFAPLAAASLVVMFTASLPISLGGWGIREMSAVVALQAIGLSSASALLLALLIGVLSVVVVAAAAGLLLLPRSMPASSTEAAIAPAFDYAVVLDWLVPIAAATAVYFQIFVPYAVTQHQSRDPLALIGARVTLCHFMARVAQKPCLRLSHDSVKCTGVPLYIGSVGPNGRLNRLSAGLCCSATRRVAEGLNLLPRLPPPAQQSCTEWHCLAEPAFSRHRHVDHRLFPQMHLLSCCWRLPLPRFAGPIARRTALLILKVA
jgi:hypothetical protein